MSQNYSLDYVIIAIVTLLQFSVSYGKALEGLDATTEILVGGKQRPGSGYYGSRPISRTAFAITGAIVLIVMLLFVVYKFRLWQCRKEQRSEDNTHSASVEIPLPQEQFPDAIDNNQQVNDAPPEYPIPHYDDYDGESNPSFSTIILSENNSILVNDEPPPPTYYDVTRSGVTPSIAHSSSQQDAPAQFPSS